MISLRSIFIMKFFPSSFVNDTIVLGCLIIFITSSEEYSFVSFGFFFGVGDKFRFDFEVFDVVFGDVGKELVGRVTILVFE